MQSDTKPNIKRNKIISNIINKPDSSSTNHLSEKLINFTYSRKSHFDFFTANNFDTQLFNKKKNVKNSSIADYQHLLIYSFVCVNIPKGSRILIIEKENSKLTEMLKHDYDCWQIKNTDELKSEFPNIVITHCNSTFEILENSFEYFDFIYSDFAFNKLSFDQTKLTYIKILSNLNNLIKPNGYSLFTFNFYLVDDLLSTNNFLYSFFNFKFFSNQTISGYEIPGNLINDSDLFYTENECKSISSLSYLDKESKKIAKVLSYNIIQRKIAKLPRISKSRPVDYLQKNPAYIFHHLIKCGGSSLGVILQKWFQVENDLYDKLGDVIGYSGDINTFLKYKFNLENMTSDFCIRGHFHNEGYFLNQRYPEIFLRNKEFRVFTFVRDPLKTLISLYYFAKNRKYLKSDLRLIDYLKTANNLLSRLLQCDESNYKEVLDSYYFIGIVENMQESFDKLAELLNKKKMVVPEYNTSEKDSQVLELSEDFIKELKEDNKLDYLIYNYCLEKFNKL